MLVGPWPLNASGNTPFSGPCCDWSEWRTWSTCDAHCGTGQRLRSRSCNVQVAFGTLPSSPSLTSYVRQSQMVRPTTNVDVYRTGFADDPAAGRRSAYAAAAARNRQAASVDEPVAPRPGVRDGIAVSAIVPMNRDKLIKDLAHRRQRRQNYWANQRYGQASVQGYGMVLSLRKNV